MTLRSLAANIKLFVCFFFLSPPLSSFRTITRAVIYPHKSAVLNEAAMQTKRENYTNAIIDTISNNVRVRQRKSWRNHPINEIPNFQ